MTPEERAKQTTEYLFTNDAGEKAVRLALIGPDGRELGGWGFDAVAGEIKRRIEEAIVHPFAVTDEAYNRVQAGGPGVVSEPPGTVRGHVVNMDRQIGHVGGTGGQAAGNPGANYNNVVLRNGNEVITSYPQAGIALRP